MAGTCSLKLKAGYDIRLLCKNSVIFMEVDAPCGSWDILCIHMGHSDEAPRSPGR